MSTLKIPHLALRSNMVIGAILLLLMTLRLAFGGEWDVLSIAIIIVFIFLIIVGWRGLKSAYIELGPDGLKDYGKLVAERREIKDVRMNEKYIVLICGDNEKSINIFDVSRRNRNILLDAIRNLITNH